MNYHDIVRENLQVLKDKYKNTDRFKARAYDNAIKGLPSMIRTYEDVKDVGGAKIKIKLRFIIENNKNLEEVDTILSDSTLLFQNNLQKIHGIGPSKAYELIHKHNISSIELLRQNSNLLNAVQKKGLRFYEDINKKIPFAEMNKHKKFLDTVLQGYEFQIAGSFRRKSEYSSDIDILLTGEQNLLDAMLSTLSDKKYIVPEGVFAKGNIKFMGMCKLPRHSTYRRIDIMYTPRDEYAFAILYFTGNYKFNTEMRRHALTKGYSLNEQGLTAVDTDKKVNKKFTTEEEIFEFLDYAYVKPEARTV